MAASDKSTKSTTEVTGGTCPVPGCGQPATADLAPNPGPNIGGGGAPPFPPPEGVTLPEPQVQPLSQFWLVLCANPAHRTLVPGAQLEDLGFTPPVTVGTRTLPEPAKPKEAKPAAGAAHATPSHQPAHGQPERR